MNVVDGWTVPGFTHVRELGTGASGRVVLAVDDLTRTEVVIKYLDQRLLADQRFRARFRAEARLLSQLEDPNVEDLYELEESPDGRHAAVVVGHVEGVPLRRILDTQGATGPLAALAVLGGTLAGLAAAHSAGVVHHDITPAHLLIDTEGTSLVTDFGLGVEGGGTAYRAPEVWDGLEPRPATDLYAATIVFYECLTGRRPYEARGRPALAKAHREGRIPVDTVPGPLRELISRGLAKDPADRPESAEEFLAALDSAAVQAYGPSWEVQGRSRLSEMAKTTAALPEQPPAQAEAAPADDPADGETRRRHRLALIALASVVVLGGVSAVAVVFGVNRLEGDTNNSAPRSSTTSATPERPSMAPRPASQAVDPATVGNRIKRAVAQQPTGAFRYQRSTCCGATQGANAQGIFRLVAGGAEPSYAMNLSGTAPELRKSMPTILVGDTGYVRLASTWRQVPVVSGQTQGYAALAARVRWATAPPSVSTMVTASSSLRQSGRVYRGTVSLARLGKTKDAGTLYRELAKITKARQLGYVLTLDQDSRPTRIQVMLPGGRQVYMTTYSDWGRSVSITAPR